MNSGFKRSALVAAVLASGIAAGPGPMAWAAARSALAQPAPVFAVDPAWPKLPNGWVFGAVSMVTVDSHDNVWILHRPRGVAPGQTPAPPVVEFAPDGAFVRAWGGDAKGYDWPDVEHSIAVDQDDNVYISGSSPNGKSKTTRSDDMIVKFTASGAFIKEFGGRTVSKGSTDPAAVNKPGDLFVWPKTNELFVADGYGDRRVLVLDADTFAFKRMWGAFGKPPKDDASSGGPGPTGGPARKAGQPMAVDAAPPPLDTQGPGPQMFASPVHGIVVSHDGIVYVADRANRRVQLFTPQGKYLKELFLNRGGPASDSVTSLALSTDPKQTYLYLADFGNSHIAVVDRKSLKILYQFGVRGAAPGDFQGLHHIAADSKGNLYAAEVAPGSRAQKFLFKGLSKTLPANAAKPDQPAPKPGAH
jgi:DNA-binding beta-propeller fold protein YncE